MVNRDDLKAHGPVPAYPDDRFDEMVAVRLGVLDERPERMERFLKG